MALHRSRARGAGAFAATASAALTSNAKTPAGRYTTSRGTVLDTKTKLTWQQAIDGTRTFTDLPTAMAYCGNLNLNGTGWRLPTVKELATLIDFSVPAPGPTIDQSTFGTAPASDATFITSTVIGMALGGPAWTRQ